MITITSAQDFLNFISILIDNKEVDLSQKDVKFPNIRFEGYPNLFFNVKGKTYSSTLTTPLLNALTGFTDEIQRAYCLLKYKTSNLQRLTTEDKEEIDIIFKIKEGSSEGESDTASIANGAFGVIQEGLKGMNGWQKLTILTVFIATLGGLGWKYLDNQREDEVTKAALIGKAIEALDNSNKQALSLLKENGQTNLSQEIEQHTEQAQTVFFKEIAKDKNAEQATLNKTNIDREQLDGYKKRTDKNREKSQKVSQFIIKGIELYAPQYVETDIDISVIRNEDDVEFTLRTSLNLMSDDELSTLKSALGTNDLIKISYQELKENGKIIKSQFIRIEK